MRFVTILLLVLSVQVAADEAGSCAGIEDRDERLACFDRLFPAAAPEVEEAAEAPADTVERLPVPAAEAEEEVPVAPAPVVEAAPVLETAPAPVAPAPSTTPVIEDTPVETAVTREDRASSIEQALNPSSQPPESLNRGGLFDSPKVDLTSTIVAIRRGDQQKMVFLLDNDQIWMQSKPRALPFEEGDTVTVKSGFVGGYFLRKESGLGTRVQRIR